MSAGAIIAYLATGVWLATLLCLFALLIAARWTRRHPDRHPRKPHPRDGM
ncbi:hypothetical protein [Nocardia sp. CA-135398]